MAFKRMGQHKTKVLAIASGGGHWVQLMRLRPAFAGQDMHFACSDRTVRTQVSDAPFSYVPDANKDHPLRLLVMAVCVAVLVLRVRPEVIVSTGAAGGFFAILFGRLIGARGLFIDSIANAEELSFSARLARRVTPNVFTQWPDVAAKTGTACHGSVLGSHDTACL